MTKPATPSLVVPPGACDTHMHVYEPRFPLAATAPGVPPAAPAEDYLAVRARLGIDRTVVVQPAAYGRDNTCTLEAMAKIGPSARGVAVVDDGVTDAELARLTAAGVRGVRFFMLRGAALPWDLLEPVAARVAPFGWHVQLQLDGRDLPHYETRLRALPCGLVVDHVGKFLEPVAPDHSAFRVLVRLVEAGRTHVKLSAPYEVSKLGPPTYDDVGRLAKELVRIAPDRMVWATNWPHPSVPREQRPDDVMLLDMLAEWAPDEAARHRILVDNPARLYGF